MGNDNPTSIKALFQGLIPDGDEVIQGIVKSAEPLRIQAVNDEKLLINTPLLIVPKHLSTYTVQVQIASYTGEMTVHNGLKVGEKVHLISFNNGKKYYVLDRV